MLAYSERTKHRTHNKICSSSADLPQLTEDSEDLKISPDNLTRVGGIEFIK